MFNKYSLYALVMTLVLACHGYVTQAQCGFQNKPENGNTYYPRTTNQTVGIGPTAFLRFDVRNTANYVWDVCGYSVYDTQLTGWPSSNTGAPNWYNDDFCVGYGGNVRASSSQYLGTNGWPSTFDGTEYVQLNPFNCAGWANYGSATLNYRCVAPTGLAVGTAGNGTWNIFCYDAGDATGGSGAWTNNYSGYYTDNTLNFNTITRWTNTPYEANASGGQAYRGCYILPDNHSWRAIRTNIACGVYQLQVTHDDIGQILINGSSVYNNAACCASTNAGTFVIAPSDVIEYRVSEGGGGSNGLITFNNAATTLNGGTISYSGSTAACASYDPPAFGNSANPSGGASAAVSNGSNTYQWQLNGGNIGGASAATYDPGALTAGSYAYRRQVTDRCGNVAYSNTVTITVTAQSVAPTLNTKTPNVASICAGTNVNASINAGSGGGSGAADSYEYSINNGGSWLPYSSGANINTASATGSVQVRVSRSSGTGTGCNAAGPNVIATWTVNPNPTAVSVASSGTYCGATFITATGGTGGTIYYQGTTSGGTSTALASSSQIITTSGTYYFRAQSAAGCWGPEGSAVIVINTPVPYYADVDGDGFGDPLVSTYACSPPLGYVSDNTDCNDANNTVHAGAPEICDGLDNNCNGSIDEGVLSTFYADTDADGFGNAAVTTQACSAPPGYVANSTDCNDANNTVYPGAPEICDGLDNNCNGSTDEGVLSTFYADTDADGFGNAAVTTQACSPPPGYVADNTDCNDANNSVYPGAPEICDGLDNNCNGSTDEGVLNTYYADTDADGFGNPAVTTQACSAPPGYVADNTDCNDANNIIYPGAPEICDGLDNNCNGSTDEGVLTTYYADADADGFGNPAVSTQACSVPPGYVTNNTDCNDANNIVYPGAPEICDGLDNNCNGSTDEGVQTTYYADTDADGFGDPLNSVLACSQPVGYLTDNTDCDDSDNSIYPGAFEICGNGIDEDCNGSDLICTGIVWNGSASTNWNTPANWTPMGIPNNCASDVTIPLVANQPSITGADFNVGDMTVANGVIISVQNGFKLNVCGDVNVSGSSGLEVDGGDMSFIGSGPQTVTGNVIADAVILSNSAGLTLAAGGSLSVGTSLSLRNGVLTSNNNLTLLSDASGTAYVDDFSGGFTGSISGNIHVQRYNPIGLPGFRQLGTPVQLPNISGLSGFAPSGTAGFVIPVPTCDPNYVAFNSPYGNWMQLVENATVQYSCHQSLFQVLTGGGMTSGRGYYLDVPGNSTLIFTGTATTGPVSFGLTHANTAVTNGWNMVSNPYPSPLAWETGNIPAGVDGIGKIWVTSGTYTGTWQDLDPNISGTSVAIGQAFQVRVTTPGASVPFAVDNSDRTTTPPTYLFAGGPGMTLNIDILGSGFADLTKVRFMDDATIALDAMYDSPKLMGNANQPMLYSIWNGENYSTNSFGGLTEVYALPLGVKLAQAGQHTLVFSNIDQFPASALIYLEDTETGAAWQDIRQNDTYVFTETVGNHTDRFILHFYPPVQSAITDATCDQYGQAVLTEETPVTWNYVLTNDQSQPVSQGSLDGSQTVNNLPAGTYTLTLTEPISGYVAVETVVVTGAVQVSAQALASALQVEMGEEIQFTANSAGADAWHWNFGDQNTSAEEDPLHFYNAPGTYEVVLTASNGTCQTISQLAITVEGSSASINDPLANSGVKLWNDGNVVHIVFEQPWTGKTVFTLYDIQGRKLIQKQWIDVAGTQSIDCGVLAAGTYTVELAGSQQTVTRKTMMGVH